MEEDINFENKFYELYVGMINLFNAVERAEETPLPEYESVDEYINHVISMIDKIEKENER